MNAFLFARLFEGHNIFTRFGINLFLQQFLFLVVSLKWHLGFAQFDGLLHKANINN